MTYSILFLDDEKDIGEPLSEILQREGYNVDYFQTGEDAVKAGMTKQYDLLLLDIMLKNFNVPAVNQVTSGIEVARIINQVNPTPYIFLTGRGDTFDVVAGLETGAAHYITKPYDMSILLATLRAFFREYERVLSMKKMHEIAEIVAGDIRIDLINRVTFLKGERVFLPDKPFAILAYLARNQDRPIKKEELLQEIWGYSPSDGIPTNTVEVNISRLRSSIGEQYIRTARGEGYYLQTKTSR